MTDLSIALSELVEKDSDVDVLREVLQFVALRMMDVDVEGCCGGRLRRACPGSSKCPQRLPGPALGDAGRRDRPADFQAAQRQLLPALSRTAPERREG